jgi:predicted nuclease of predicted toxin-antitoxin system
MPQTGKIKFIRSQYEIFIRSKYLTQNFNDLSSLYGFPPKVIWIRTGNMRTQSIANILQNYNEDITKFMNDSNYGCFEIFKVKSR